jgi:alpha-amylase
MPTASYDKMSYWVLPTPERISLERLIQDAKEKRLENSQELLKFLRGGFWRQFLVKYYESNNMHKKMLYVREKLRFIEKEWGRDDNTKRAVREIYKAQCNDPYWHGQFGGVYFGFMRQNVYNYLIEAEKIIEKISQAHRKITPVVVPYDIDKDGREEILLETSLITLYFHPFRGGSIFEIDHKAKSVNILNTFQRRKEAYYKEDLKYVVDRWRRHAFYDHFVSNEITLEALINDNYLDLGNFVKKSYESDLTQTEQRVSVRLSANGEVSLGGELNPLLVSKFFEVREDKNEIRITFKVENKGDGPIEINHLTEIPLYITGATDSIRFKCDKAEAGILEDQTLAGKTIQIDVQQNEVTLKINLSDPCEIFKYNLYTYARTNGGYDTMYQGTVLAFKKPLQLDPGEISSWKMNITLE